MIPTNLIDKTFGILVPSVARFIPIVRHWNALKEQVLDRSGSDDKAGKRNEDMS